MKSNQRATIETLLERNTPQREIARITGIDRKTVRSYQRRWLAQANSPGVATGPEALASQTPPPWPPATAPVGAAAATSLCEPHRAFIEAQLLLKRNAVASYQDLVDSHGFAGAYNSVKRFVARLRRKVSVRPTHLDDGRGDQALMPAGVQCCGSSSSMRLLGQVGSLSITSLR